jgi:metal-dependent amidase/aminoacylase/carboxypeptidase family protein
MPMAFLDIDDELCAELGVPAINPAKVELGVAEALVRARLRPSRLTNPLPPKLAGDTTLAELQIVRTFGSDVKAQVRAAIERMAAGVAAAHRCTATVTYEEGYGPVVNDAEVSALVRSTRLAGVADRARARHGRRGLLRLPAGRARLFLRGVGGGGDAFPHHHPRFAVDEEAIGVAVDVFVATTLDFLHRRN